jgi:pilus assembly protein CpaC
MEGTCRLLPRAVLLAAPLVLALMSPEVLAQHDGRLGGLRPLVPPVPPSHLRPLQGEQPDEQFDPTRDKEPVASFIDTIKGNDAAIEVIVGQGKLLTIKHAMDIAVEGRAAVIAVGDPTILDFQVLPNPRLIRLIGLRVGVTDLSVTSPDGKTFAFEVHVVYDLPLLRAQLKQVFPDANLRLAQMREHVIVEGQARSPREVSQIITTLQAYLDSAQVPREVESPQPTGGLPQAGRQPRNGDADRPQAQPEEGEPAAAPETGRPTRTRGAFRRAQIINLLKVPGVHQVLLKVRIAELNRTRLREIGADILQVDPDTGNILGTQIAGGTILGRGLLGIGGLTGAAEGSTGLSTTGFGIFPSSDFEILLRALRRNSLLTILAEPNLIAMSGHHANFLAGGEFPVPVPQGGSFNQVTIEFKEFGVRLDFVPYVIDEDTVRLTVAPEVSSIDFSLGTTLVVGGSPVPGLNTRRTETTVELG